MPTDLENSTDDDQTSDDSPIIRDLRKKADRADAVESENVNLKRELAVTRAGLDSLNEDQMSALAAVHKGDWDADSVKATAERLGFGTPSTEGAQTTEPKIPEAELQAHQRVAAAANGETAPPSPDLTAAINEIDDRDPNGPEKIKALLRNAGRLAEGQ